MRQLLRELFWRLRRLLSRLFLSQELVRRLLSRHSDNRAQQELRIKNAVKELACSDKYDYIIVNETVEQAAAQFVEIVKKHREEQS